MLILQFTCNSQNASKSATTLFNHPNEADTIFTHLVPMKEGDEPGPKVGSKVDFFKLYGLKNDSLDIAVELGKGKPVFLINGSYTCPQYRHQLHFFDSLNQIYHNDISFYVVYSIEAHPHYPDPSPYTGKLFISSRNSRDQIFYRQPKTYAERQQIANEMVNKTKLKIPVFIDTPDNQWLTIFGTLPTTAYMINPSGKIIYKYLDYDKYTGEILRDIKEVLNRKKK
jgi:hypothetical protein